MVTAHDKAPAPHDPGPEAGGTEAGGGQAGGTEAGGTEAEGPGADRPSAGGPGAGGAGGPVVLVLGRAVRRAEVPGLCARLRELASQSAGAGPVVVDVGAVRAPDLAVLEALARLRLTARRLGRQIRLRGASGELRALLARAGLDAVLPAADLPGGEGACGVEAGGQAEEGEQAGGVQEGVERGDPAG
ncbi:STAS domain-containing protein [Streptomyces sparsogenes]|uniref:STAS domain-containing protein n=1 Tax=Streptomyces sparsogenes TaxID=67365 RepID=UPI003324537B